MEDRMRSAFSNVNWKKLRVSLLKRSVPVPAPIFFLIFFAIGWACFSLYFKIDRTTKSLEELESRTSAIESHLQTGDDSSGDNSPDDEGEYTEPHSPALEM